jgi:hypothetical protein
MRIDRTAAVVALLGATAVGFAGPAWAEEFSGLYSVDRSGATAPGMAPGTSPTQWTVKPCGSGCAYVFGDNGLKWDAHLVNGRWSATVQRPDAIDCKNGTAAAGTSTLSLDAGTLQGTMVSTSDGPACGSPTPITGPSIFIIMDKA